MDNRLYLGVDIGGTAVKLGIVDVNGRVLSKASYDVAFDNYNTRITDTVIKSIHSFLKGKAQVCGIGVSATGQIDVEKGAVIGGNGYIKNYVGDNIKELLGAEFSLPVTVINDANAVAVAESRFGAAVGKTDALVVTIGTGVGGGIISGGVPLMGHRGIGGGVGHLIVNFDGEKCSCGNNGCLEKYASVTALVNRVKEEKELIKFLSATAEEIDGRWIFAHIDNAVIKELVAHWIEALASGIIGLCNVLNPQIVLIGGGISKEEENFIVPLRKRVLSTLMPRYAENLEIKAAKLGNDAGIIGGVAYFIENGDK